MEGCNPVIKETDIVYEIGKKVTKEIMKIYEEAIDRDSKIGKWFITIRPEKCIRHVKKLDESIF